MPKIIGIKPQIQKFVDLEKIAMETNPEESNTPQTEKSPPTNQEIEEYFTLQGELIESHLHDGGAYPNCPVCTHAKKSLEEIVGLLQASVLELDKAKEHDLQNGTTSTSGVYDRMRCEIPWFELAKSISLAMAQSGHMPESVMRQHPELVVSKAQKRKIRSSKHKKQIAKESRRKNRH